MSDLHDEAARERIRTDTGATLFVNAGAGSGKTTALVDRVASLVLTDNLPLHAIAAVTFTEKAGAELRDRLRSRFEKARRDQQAAGSDTAVVDEALDDLDSAAIGTLHSFAQRILMEHPIEAGLPPVLEVLDEVGSSVAFEDRWAALQVELLDDDSMAEPLLLGMACGVKLEHVRSLAHLLGSDWDLIEDRVLRGPEESVHPPRLDALIAEAARVGARAHECLDESDKLLPKVQAVAETAVLLAAAPDVESQLGLLRSFADTRYGVGRKASWPDKDAVVRDCQALAEVAGEVIQGVLDGSLRALTRWAARRVLASAELRRAAGKLEFHDLLVLARDLLRGEEAAGVRAALQARYQRILLDEFQDTDPIQIELAVRICAGADASATDWRDIELPPGRLFVVGDPKQSIYRFRRASVATYLQAQERLGESVSLTTNFRTLGPVLDWVNTVFGELIQPVDGGQPSYEALHAHRDEAPGGPAVMVLGAEPHTDLARAWASELREREARDVAAAIRLALDDGWPVYDKDTEQWRAARRDDIAILVPARTSLPFLEDALDAAGVPYRAEASSLVYQAAEVRSLLACARAIADSSDALSLVTALRSPVFGCGDDDLWRWKRAGGRFSIYSELPDDEPVTAGPVGTALRYLRRLSFEARWLTPSEVLAALVADRRMFELAATGPRGRDSWRRLRFVVDQARAWAEASPGGLRAYLSWAAHQGQEAARVAEAVLPETDADAVKVMTIHAAKGLEFPIVVLSGMTAAPNRRSGVRLLWTADSFAVKFGASVQTDDFDIAAPVDEQMDELEKRRLLYVATTRARDHLVVSLHRADTGTTRTAARLLADAGSITSEVAQMEPAALPAIGAAVEPAAVTPPPVWGTWLAELEETRERARRAAAVSASGLEGTAPEVVLAPPSETEQGLAKGPRDVALPPWSKGRYGSAIGRAVHGVLQLVDLSTGDGLADAVAAQCLAEGVSGQEGLVEALVRSALESEVVNQAAQRQHWRETYVGTVQPDGTVLEGYVDLVYRDDDGSLVVVDYKTDAVPAGGIPSRVTYYAPQMNAYRECLVAATGSRVSTTLLFLNPEVAISVPVEVPLS